MKITFSKILTYAINLAGIACLVYFGARFLSGSEYVANPDAMLPMAVWDGSGFCLTIGFLPLLFANFIGFLSSKGAKMRLRLLWFIPSIICAVLVVLYLIKSLA